MKSYLSRIFVSSIETQWDLLVVLKCMIQINSPSFKIEHSTNRYLPEWFSFSWKVSGSLVTGFVGTAQPLNRVSMVWSFCLKKKNNWPFIPIFGTGRRMLNRKKPVPFSITLPNDCFFSWAIVSAARAVSHSSVSFRLWTFKFGGFLPFFFSLETRLSSPSQSVEQSPVAPGTQRQTIGITSAFSIYKWLPSSRKISRFFSSHCDNQ